MYSFAPMTYTFHFFLFVCNEPFDQFLPPDSDSALLMSNGLRLCHTMQESDPTGSRSSELVILQCPSLIIVSGVKYDSRSVSLRSRILVFSAGWGGKGREDRARQSQYCTLPSLVCTYQSLG